MGEITRVIEKMNDAGEDPGYHYEEMASVSKLKKYGIWDVPGTAEMVGLWPMFYRYIKVCAILFVVDGSEEFTKRGDKLTDVGRLLSKLLNEDELRTSTFILIINDKDTRPDAQRKEPYASCFEVLKDCLNVHNMEKNPRFRACHMDCSKVTDSSHEWQEILKFIWQNKQSQLRS